ncbi:MAG: helix-turn-helix domain-containing protein [Deferrisomatales bacterium]
MRRGQDVSVTFPGLYVVHQNLPGRVVARYRRPEHVVFVPIRGEIEVGVGSRVLRCGPGRLAYLPPGTVHGMRGSDREGERLIALVEEGAWQAAGGAVLAPCAVPAGPVIRDALLYLLLNPDTRAAPGLLQALVAIVGETRGSLEPGADLDHLEGLARDPRLRAALAYLRAHLLESPSIPELADAAGLSVRSLNRLFTRELGLTPKAVLVRNRIELARQWLATGGRSVTEVALAAGYGSLSQFVVAFRRATGQLPSEVALGRGGGARGPS